MASRRRYWEFHSQAGYEWAQGVPTDAMPLGLYGDGARVNTKFGSINLIALFFSIPLWKPKTVRASRFLITVLPEEKLWKHHSLQVVLRRITWSINSLISGKHPAKGPYNEDLPKHLLHCAGRRFIFNCSLSEIRGDWQWLKRIFRFKCAWNAVNVCHFCRALSKSNDPADLYWAFENNNWDAHRFSVEEFLDERIPSTGISFLV